MSNFKTQVDLIDNGSGSYTLEYNVFSPGRKFTQGTVTKTQIDTYDSQTQALPGVRVEIKLEDDGPGNPFSIPGVVTILPPLVLNVEKPFLDVVFLAWDSASQTYKEKGGGITRKVIPD